MRAIPNPGTAIAAVARRYHDLFTDPAPRRLLMAATGSYLGDRLSTIALVALSFVIFAFSGASIAGLVVGVIVLDVGVQAAQISNQSRIYALKPEARSRVNTVYMVAYFIGGAIGSVVGTTAWRLSGWTGVCIAGLVFAGLAAWAHAARHEKALAAS